MPSTITDRLNGLTTSVAVKPPCVTVASSNITQAGLQTIASVAVVEGDRVLCIGQTNQTLNGIWLASTGDWTRAKDFDGNRDAVQGTLVLVRNQFVEGAFYEVTTPNPITFGSSNITFRLRDAPNVTFDITQAEVDAAVTPSDYSYQPGDPRRYGAVGDGVTDDSAAFQRMVNAGNCASIPEPPTAWRFNASVTVPSNRTVAGFRGRTRITFAPASRAAFLVAAGSSNVNFESLVFEGDADSVVHWAIELVASDSVRVEDCQTVNCLLLICNSSGANYAAVNDGNSCHDIWASRNRITGSRLAGAQGAVTYFYVRGGGIVDNYFEDVPGGVQLWGGNADPAIDGPLANERKCRDITVTGNTVRRAQAGLWGSMMQSCAFAGNTVYDCTDVGLDAEGAFEVAFSGNSAQDCVNGCLTIFSYNRNIIFTGNVVSTTNASWPLVRIYNSAQNTENKGVLFEANSFRGIGVIGLIDNANGPCMVTNFRANHMFNARVSFTFSNGGHIINIQDNDLYFDIAAGASFSALAAGGNNQVGGFAGRCTIRDNKILSSVAQPAGSNGVGVTQGDTNASPITLIEANEIAGFTNDIATVWTGANAGFAAVFKLLRNFCGAGSYSRTETGAAQSQVFAMENDGLSIIRPAQLTANQNNYFPTGAATGDTWFLTSDASRNITGFAGGVDGLTRNIVNSGVQDIVVTNNDAASLAANRVVAGASITLNSGEGLRMIYDGTSSLWRVISKHA